VSSGAYAFASWLRRGISSKIATIGDQGPTTETFASVEVGISINQGSLTAAKKLHLVGPGEVTGIDPRTVLRVWPSAGAYDAAANYLPLIEFDQPDLPWRYTPAHPDSQGRLRPWICLIALKDEEHELREPDPDHPLPVVRVSKDAPLPNPKQTWAWAHVQVDGLSTVTAADIETLIENEPARLLARLLCPRRLEARTPYTVFLVPSFERGRLAGLGQAVPESVHALDEAWTQPPPPRSAALELPVYHSWEFTSVSAEDFGALVRRLRKKAITEGGMRAMDVGDPGLDLGPASSHPLGLEGAMRAPALKSTPWDATERDAWITELKGLVDTPTTLMTAAGAGRRLAPPLYGRWHAGHDVLATHPASGAWSWFDELNADPRLRVAAALGVAVVQSRQDQLVAGAWRQVEGIRELNAELRQAQAARELARRVHERHLASPDPQVALQLTGPVHGRIIRDATTLTLPSYFARAGGPGTAIRPGVLAPQWRRIARRTGPVARRQGALTGDPRASTLLERLVKGELQIAPPPPTPSLMANLSALGIQPQGDPATAPGGGPGFQPREFPPESIEGWNSAPAVPPGGPDSGPGAEFRAAVAASWPALTAPEPPVVKLTAVDLEDLSTQVLRELDPESTVTQLYQARMTIDPGFAWDPADQLEPVMAAPTFPNPMFEPLRELSQDWVFPGLDKVPPNTMSLLEINRRFVYAYMVGLNHEMAGALLWNGYPTDLRGTHFKHFWDPASYYGSAGQTLDPSTLEDVDPITDWPTTGASSALAMVGKKSPLSTNPLVLLLRGDLLARYPNLLVYAAKAKLRTGATDPQDPKQREPDDAHEERPIFGGTLKPDVSFFAFADLTAAKVTGGATDPGWYFILQEQPSETRFNLNTDVAQSFSTWEDLAWGDLAGAATVAYIDLDNNKPTKAPAQSPATWATSTGAGTAADMASITLQKRVRLAVHGSDMVA
jgi:hypothetical protein